MHLFVMCMRFCECVVYFYFRNKSRADLLKGCQILARIVCIVAHSFTHSIQVHSRNESFWFRPGSYNLLSSFADTRLKVLFVYYTGPFNSTKRLIHNRTQQSIFRIDNIDKWLYFRKINNNMDNSRN